MGVLVVVWWIVREGKVGSRFEKFGGIIFLLGIVVFF